MLRKFRSTADRKTARLRRAGRAVIESMEQRCLLSAAADTTVAQPAAVVSASQASASGYTPGEIQQAYGFNAAAFTSTQTYYAQTAGSSVLTWVDNSSATANQSVAGTGAGQTIAIVEAYKDPTIAADLHHFDKAYGLPDTSLVQMNQTGGSKLPAADAGWAQETALDVEWAHAIAPGANIVLVEASSDHLNDLLAAVDTARHLQGVSVVSMSWGVGEFAGETSLDALFTTPDGHQPVTFVAASGDRAATTKTQWPASSPNVLSVGGASLTLQPASGGMAAELPWSGSVGGTSTIEPQPAYQAFYNGAASGRTTPDVVYNADPTPGYSVYDSTPIHGISGWRTVGGTSAGAPQWAALVAIANQGRELAGQSTLDGPTGTLPALAQFYAANPGSSPGTKKGAGAGNDLTDANGMPQAAKVIAALVQHAPADAATNGPVDHDEPARQVPANDAKTKARYFYLAPILKLATSPPMSSAPLDAARADLRKLFAGAMPLSAAIGSSSAIATLGDPGGQGTSDFAPAVASLGEFSLQHSPVSESAMAAALRALTALLAADPVAAPGAHGAQVQADDDSILPLAGHPILHIPRLNLAASLTQGLGAFINEFASLAPSSDEAAPDPDHMRAWGITVGVLAADAIVIGYAAHRRPNRRKNCVFVKGRFPASGAPAGAWGMQLG
ncbi:MAG: pcp 3 [Phycisphaerales bacterium]|nr:pcp 3 [Phycisphaerales bacterium]